MLSIITRSNNPYTAEHIKYFLNSRVLKRKRGPQSVIDSLVRGLAELGEPFRLNPALSDIDAADTVVVISGIKALQEAIELKKAGAVKKLCAGPCVTVLPSEEGGIMLDKNIDHVIVPSQWVRDLYISLHPGLTQKIIVWPAGVEDAEDIETSQNDGGAGNAAATKENKESCLIYRKGCDEDIFYTVKKTLSDKGIAYDILDYGSFRQKDFFDALAKSAYMVYLSASESQGLALQEAWIRNVPTFVWDRGYWEYKGMTFKHELISAPYLTPETGMSFGGAADFEANFDVFLKSLGTFAPRGYSEQHFTDKVCAKLLVDAIK